jgi:hypothetical protein
MESVAHEGEGEEGISEFFLNQLKDGSNLWSDFSDFDRSVDPRDNLYLFSNGGWLNRFGDKEIPRDFRKW